MREPDRLRARDVLRRTLIVYRRRWRFMLAAGALLFVPLGLLSALDNTLLAVEKTDPVPVLSFFALSAGASVIGNVLFASLVAAAVLHVQAGGELSVRAAAARMPWWRLIAVDVLFALATVLGLLLLIVPGLIVLARFALAPVLVELEGRDLRGCFARSGYLTRGHVGLLLRTLLPVLALTGFGNEIFQELVAGGGLIGDWAASSLSSIALNPLYAIATVVLALELRRP